MSPSQVGFHCAMCLSAVPLTECKLLPCYHGFCDECVDQWLESNRIGSQKRLRQLYCPTCRKPARESDLGRMFVETVMLDEDMEGKTRLLTARQETKEEKAEEPQNPLTKKFTKSEWKALKELRTKLPHIFETAFREKENKLSSVTLWGVPINPLNPAADARASVILVKFLRARNLNVEKATKMMISTFKWRDEFKIDELATEGFTQDVFGLASHIFGKDKDGRPVIYNIHRGNKDIASVSTSVLNCTRWGAQLMEHSIRSINFVNVDSMVEVHDCESGIPGGDVNSKPTIDHAWRILHDYYPEFSFKKFFINVPTYMAWGFWLFKPWIAANTLAKLRVAGSDAATISKALLTTIDAKELPKRYGGEAEAFWRNGVP